VFRQAQARVNLEQARQQLEEAQRREAEQLRVIKMLERENRKWRDKQRSIGNDIMANNDCMANINSIARCGARPPSVVPTIQSTVLPLVFVNFYCAMLCIHGTSHGPVSMSVCVCHKSVFY